MISNPASFLLEEETATLRLPRTTSDQVATRLNALESILNSFGPDRLTSTAADQLRALAEFRADETQLDFPKNRLAGVLILLNVLPDGSLGVTLTTRSSKLRAHPGDTALPGGKYEVGDRTIEMTALREANEEISLALSPSSDLFHLTTLPPFASATLLVVIPVVYLFTRPGPLPTFIANPDEVEHVFNVPLSAFHQPLTNPRKSGEVDSNGVQNDTQVLQFDYSYIDIPWLDSRPYRLRAFDAPTLPSKISGLTADILLLLVRIIRPGPGDESEKVIFEDWHAVAENQMSWDELVRRALSEPRRGKENSSRKTVSGSKKNRQSK